MKATINGISIGYYDSGSGPAVCLIHGFPLDRRMWRPQVMELASAGYRVITPDLRGFGESDAPEGAYAMDLFADDLAALLDYLNIGHAVVGGMSMGGTCSSICSNGIPNGLQPHVSSLPAAGRTTRRERKEGSAWPEK